MRIRVLLVEDHLIVRQGLVALLGASQDIEVVGEAADGAQAVQLCLELRPNVVVMDLSLPGLHGTEALRRVRAICDAKVVVLSMHTSPEVVARAREAGCAGYVVKGADVSELARAIRSAMSDEAYFSPELRRELTPVEDLPTDPLARLSGREREVLQLVAEGNTNREIATRLGISVHTVNAHRVNLMSKLNLHDAQGLTRFAIRHGLIDQ
jgi:DNA-binding NarL/FixJ family response regulator